MSIERIENLFANDWLCIEPSELERIYASLHVLLNQGEKIEGLFNPIDENNLKSEIVNGVAYLQVKGLLVKHPNFFTRYYGDTSYDELAREVRHLANDPTIRAIVLLFDTPGGTVSGVADCADAIYEARDSKPVIGLANDMAASGGIWLASACSEFNVTQTSITGSIGVIVTVTEYSKLYAENGIGKHVIRAGEFKAVGGPNEPLSDKFRETIQNRINKVNDLFIRSVARHLDTSEQNVASNMGDGHLFFGTEAVEVGLASRVTTLENIVAEYGDDGQSTTSFFTGAGNARQNDRIESGDREHSDHGAVRSGFSSWFQTETSGETEGN